MLEKIKSAFLGLAVGDALGVPVEFKSREWLKLRPVTEMQEYGTHNQKAGTWSDDSSLTFCLADSFDKGYDLQKIADNFVAWNSKAYWTAYNQVFDIGNTTYVAIKNLENGISPEKSGATEINSNGNGSLMRILPLAFYLKNKTLDERFEIIKQVSSLTHAHYYSIVSCFIYVEYAILLINGNDKFLSYQKMQNIVNNYFDKINLDLEIRLIFNRILKNKIWEYNENIIQSSGFVIHSLEASLWCLLKYNNYSETVLAAVNLGLDTDTTATITGGLAGLTYGKENIPEKWLNVLARKNDIENLAERFYKNII